TFCLFTDSPNKNMPRSAVRMMVSADHTAYTIPISKYLIADEMKKFVKMKRINAVRVGSNTLKPFDIFTHIWANIANMIPKRSEEHTFELQSRFDLVCRLLLEKKKNKNK